VRALFGARSTVQAMLDVEAALARAQAREGQTTDAAAAAIAAACDAAHYDADALVAAARSAGSLAIPLVKRLTEAVAAVDRAAADRVHVGATSQDVVDTALVLLTRRALALLDRDIARLVDGLLALAHAHGDAPLLARTLLQPAGVTSFGLKVAGWTAPLLRGRQRLHDAGSAALVLQLGGAVGTRTQLGSSVDAADAVAQRVADALQLPAAAPWHTQRDALVALGCAVGVLVGSAGKLAQDLALMAQGEVGELSEGAAGGSSAMPHKRNPVAALQAIAAAARVPQRVAALLATMAQPHERGLGTWQAEGAEWVALLDAAHAALRALADAVPQLQVDVARMRANLDATHGLVFAEAAASALGASIGKVRAQKLLETLSRRVTTERRALADLLRDEAAGDAALRIDDALFDPDVAAQPARERARRQLDALRAEAARFAAPWAAWLPSPAA
jgi:3-carboxy-cis,cis-muconate cycloisomerase